MNLSIGVIMYQTSNSKGQELAAQRMVKWLRRLGHDAYLITSNYHDNEIVVREEEMGDRGYLIMDPDPYVGIPTVRIRAFSVNWPPRRIMFKDFIHVLTRLAGELRLNVLITHSTLWNGPEDVAKFVQWRRTSSLLSGACEDYIFCHMSHYQPPDPAYYEVEERSYRIAWNKLLFPLIFSVADLILCVTPIEAMDMVLMGARRDQVYVYPIGIDDDEFEIFGKVDSSDFRQRYGIPENVKIVAYLGTIEKRKNPLAVVRVARKLRHRRDVHFVIAGKPGNQWEDVVRESRDLSNVTLTGELDHIDKIKLIKESYLNIIMSKMEALGLTQIEFMYGGVPVITSAVYGQRWVVRDGVDGFHVEGPDDIDGAARYVEYLLDHPDVRDELGRNARERARQFLLSYTTSRLAEKLVEVYKLKSSIQTCKPVMIPA